MAGNVRSGPGNGVTRRRVLALVAASGVPLAFGADGARPVEKVPVYRWRGRALGAAAHITLAHPDAAAARTAIAHCIAEVIRLEAAFSLFLGESEISRLNRDGRLRGASLDFRTLLAESQRFGDLTGGAFDVTVQPLWRLYSRHFAAVGPDGDPPAARTVADARRRIDYRQIDVSGTAVGFLGPGMALTLNGIAQGYITDRVVAILRNEGFHQVLADLGEIAALDPPNGQAGWPVRIGEAGPASRDTTVALHSGRAIATSLGKATRFDRSGQHHHLFDPRTGFSAPGDRSVSVIAGSTTAADALSTALSVLPADAARRVLRGAGADRAIFRDADGQTVDVVA